MKMTYIFNEPITSDKASLVQTVNMCDAFAGQGVEVEIALPLSKNKKSFDYLYRRFGIINEFKLSFYSKMMVFNRLGILGSYFGVKEFLKKTKADIYFTRCPMIFTILSAKKLPVIYEAHNARIHNDSEYYNRFWTNNVIKASQMSNCYAFITISKSLGDYWSEIGVPLMKILPLHDGFNFRMFKENISKSLARLELGFPLEDKIITYTGSLYHDRKIENVINLANHLPENFFVVVGGPQKNSDYYKSLAIKNDVKNIKFTGPVEHSKIPLYLYASDVLLALWSHKVPTINYCSPLKIFEYMAAGRVIVAHSFPTIKEVIRHMENGLLVEPDNFKDLVTKTNIALYDVSQDKIGDLARKEAFEKYPWNERASQILRAIKTNSDQRVFSP